MEKDSTDPKGWGNRIALASVSSGIIAFQIVLMQVLASVVWYHFAYLIISFALLGFGLSGTLLSIRGRGRLESNARFIPLLASISAWGMVASIVMLSVESLSIDLYSLFSDPSVLIGCTLFQMVLLVPFTAGALVIAILFLGRPSRAGATYAINLGSSAVGALIAHLLPRADGDTMLLIYDLGVEERYRRRGIASALVGEAEAIAREAGASKMWVVTGRTNKAAMALYTSLGGVADVDDDVVFGWRFAPPRPER